VAGLRAQSAILVRDAGLSSRSNIWPDAELCKGQKPAVAIPYGTIILSAVKALDLGFARTFRFPVWTFCKTSAPILERRINEETE
jgi:hypothetical protein